MSLTKKETSFITTTDNVELITFDDLQMRNFRLADKLVEEYSKTTKRIAKKYSILPLTVKNIMKKRIVVFAIKNDDLVGAISSSEPLKNDLLQWQVEIGGFFIEEKYHGTDLARSTLLFILDKICKNPDFEYKYGKHTRIGTIELFVAFLNNFSAGVFAELGFTNTAIYTYISSELFGWCKGCEDCEMKELSKGKKVAKIEAMIKKYPNTKRSYRLEALLKNCDNKCCDIPTYAFLHLLSKFISDELDRHRCVA